MAQALDADQIGALSDAFTDLADAVRAILNDESIPLTRGQGAALSSDLTTLGTIASNLATTAASVAFDDSQSAFTDLSRITKDANDEARRLSANAAHITAVVNVIGAFVSVGTSFGSGPGAVLGALGNLATAVNASKATA